MQEVVFLADLMELVFGEFDLILGIDWFVKHQGSEAFLACVSVSDVGDSLVKDIRTIKDFPNAFLEELPGLPPEHEVEFGIELFLEKSFEKLKKALTEAPALIQLVFGEEFTVYNDASYVDLGCVLVKEGKIEYHPSKANVVADALSCRTITDLRVMFARLSLFDNGNLLAELQVKHVWIVHIKTKQMENESLGLRFRQVENGNTGDFGLNNEGLFKILMWTWERVTMDFMSGLPLTPSKKDSVWVIVDGLTKIAHFIPVRIDYSLQKLAKLYISEIVRLHGVPVSIIFDRDPCFMSRFWKKLHEALGPVAYQLELPPELEQIHDVFHISMLRRYRTDPTHVVPVEEIEIRLDLTFEEEPVQFWIER
ncbi:uncharacterized protein [Gossypium hirsutum]|uniref:Uncharacterized protein n=1 Tax=Gossypium hirsutum TaxID=3635 RepID=A0ABM3BW94_GOSHI|nr:uncharacterized protein LOC121230490 [Gossypium hirsutum]